MSQEIMKVALDAYLKVDAEHSGFSSSRRLEGPPTSACKCGADLSGGYTTWRDITEVDEPNWHYHRAEVISSAVAHAALAAAITVLPA